MDFTNLHAWLYAAIVVVQLMKSISDKHEEVMARMGSIMAAGILDAGEQQGAVRVMGQEGCAAR